MEADGRVRLERAEEEAAGVGRVRSAGVVAVDRGVGGDGRLLGGLGAASGSATTAPMGVRAARAVVWRQAA